MTPLEVHPLPGLGAEISGVDLAAITVGDWNQLQAAFAAFGLLVFTDQILTEDDHVAFAERWGSVENVAPAARGAHPSIAVETSDSPSTRPTGVWHADQSFRPDPPFGFVEIARHLPPSGARTQFVSTPAAFAQLSSVTQRALEALNATHVNPTGPESESCDHPIVIKHPVSGERALFVNPTFTAAVRDMDERPGLSLLNQLYEHSQLPEFTTTIEWELGMVVLWDNRSIWHFAGEHDRPLTSHRVTIAGTPLRPWIDPEKKTPSLTERAGATLAGGILTAAMTGIAEVFDPERVKQDIEIVSEAPEREPLTDLDFGGLPPLD